MITIRCAITFGSAWKSIDGGIGLYRPFLPRSLQVLVIAGLDLGRFLHKELAALLFIQCRGQT
jgi:hypothetical protein